MVRKSILSVIVLSFVCQSALSANSLQDVVSKLQSEPYDTSVENNGSIYSQYCTGQADSTRTPKPKYSNSLVKKAGQILGKTQKDANSILKESAEKEWVSSVEYFKGQLQALKASENSLIADLATKLDNSIESSSDKYSSDQKGFMDLIYKSSLGAATKSLTDLQEVLNSELKGLDKDLFVAAAKKLNENVQIAFVDVDVEKIKGIASSLVTEIEKQSLQQSSEKTLEAAKKITPLLIAMEGADEDEKQYINWAAEASKKLQVALEVDMNSLVESQYVIDEILYIAQYYDEQNKELPANIKLQMDVLTLQRGAISAENALVATNRVIDGVQRYLDQDPAVTLSNLQSITQSLVYSLRSLERAASSEFLENIKSYKVEIVKFKSSSVKEQSKKVVVLVEAIADDASLEQSVKQAAILVREIGYLEEIPQAVVESYNVLKSEVAKKEQDKIKADIISYLAVLSGPVDGVDGNTIYGMSRLSQELESQSMNISAETLKKVTAFKNLSDELKLISNLRPILEQENKSKPAGHFYFYGSVRKLYGLNSMSSSEAPYGKNAHKFLVQLCGEYRDRATMIEAKLKWITNLFTLPKAQTVTSIDFSKNIWKQMSAPDYSPFLHVTKALWEARKAAKERYIKIGQYETIDNPIEGPTVCETKYIFEKYVKKSIDFDDLETYTKDYEDNYRSLCNQADQNDYYDFRGDSNFKHYSPESNAMIWYAKNLARACKSKKTAKDGHKYTDQDCENYFSRPFYYRYNAARSAIATGLFHDAAYAKAFDSQGDQMVNVLSHTSPDLAPMGFKTSLTEETNVFAFDPAWYAIDGAWNKPGIGFNEFTGLGTDNPNQELAYERLRGSVDRHTNWYAAGYDDGNGVTSDQAFSPFVASSYVMEASDAFTTCGITVQCPPDGLKRWMFVFRVKKDNWYNPQRILDNEPVDFDKMWFDETSFGDSHLANGESAWDRMGTAMEEELDSILYLINVEGGGNPFMGIEPEQE